jgi:beta-N-acetylhexosaminidase
MRLSGTVKFPHQMAYAAGRNLEATRKLGLHTAREARALGVHWVFAPDADVNNNSENPVIGLRSFSEDADETAAHVKAYIEGAHSDPANPVLVCAKHFPGHGDTNVDSHDGFGRISGTRERLDAVELKPFRAAIAAGVDSVMTAHLAVPALEPEEIPVTVSEKVMTGLLKQELKFSGIVTTDAMDMHGLSRQLPAGEAAIRAILAGVDVLLIPPNAERAIDAVVQAVESGRIPRDRIRTSVEKVLTAKVRLGLHKKRLVQIEEIAEQADSEEAEEQARQAAEGGLTLVRNDRDVFPIRDANTACAYVLSERRYSQMGRRFLEGVEELAPRMLTRFLDASMPEAGFAELTSHSASCSKIIVATFVTGAAYRGDSSLVLSPPLTKFLNGLIATGVPVGLISFGNPYLLRAFPNVSAYVATFSTAPTSEAAMAKALTGEIGFRGRLPVTIPGVAAYGTGIQTGGQ